MVVRLRTWLVRLGFGLGSLRPPARRVLLATSHAERLGGNLAFIRRRLRRDHPTVPVVVLAHRATSGWRGRFGAALAEVRAGYALARARLVIVDAYFFAIYVITPHPQTTIVQTWHASGAFKKFGHSVADATSGANRELKSGVRVHANYDLCLVGSAQAAVHYAEAYDLPADRFVTRIGIPRTDLFFGPEAASVADDVRRRYGLTRDRRVVLYAPTFRGDSVTDARDPGFLDLHALRRAIGEDHVVLLRLHPFVRARSPIGPELAGFTIDASDEPDINALMLVSDVLVTDYSSAVFEYALLERPMAFFAPDLAAYEQERGFYVDYRSWVPGPVFEDSGALAAWLRAGDFDLERVGRFRAASFEVADGQATRRFVDEIVLPALDAPLHAASATAAVRRSPRGPRRRRPG